MKSFEAKWSDLTASTSPREEAARVEELMDIARKNHILYQLAVFDAATGKAIPVAALGNRPQAQLRIQVTAGEGSDKRTLIWKPRDAANVLPLLRE